MLDGHIHILKAETGPSAIFTASLKAAGMEGGVLISLPPAAFPFLCTRLMSTRERLDNLFSWTGAVAGLYPFFWIDPLEDDASEQVGKAVQRGVAGFKVICNRFYPGDERALRVFRVIAAAGKPILFHAGILWDGEPSSKFNRPAEFEALLDVPGLRFSLAHIAWPWCDELIAAYGKFANAHGCRPDLAVDMFVDITPGTPPIYRREALTRLLTVGYPVGENIIFGTDSEASHYLPDAVHDWVKRDNGIYRELKLDSGTVADIYTGNLRRFLRVSP